MTPSILGAEINQLLEKFCKQLMTKLGGSLR